MTSLGAIFLYLARIYFPIVNLVGMQLVDYMEDFKTKEAVIHKMDLSQSRKLCVRHKCNSNKSH